MKDVTHGNSVILKAYDSEQLHGMWKYKKSKKSQLRDCNVGDNITFQKRLLIFFLFYCRIAALKNDFGSKHI